MKKTKRKEPARIVAELKSRAELEALQDFARKHQRPDLTFSHWVRQTLFQAAGLR